MNKKQLYIVIGTIILALIVFLIPMSTVEVGGNIMTGTYANYHSNSGTKMAIVIAISLIGIATTFYFKDKK